MRTSTGAQNGSEGSGILFLRAGSMIEMESPRLWIGVGVAVLGNMWR